MDKKTEFLGQNLSSAEKAKEKLRKLRAKGETGPGSKKAIVEIEIKGGDSKH